MYTVKKCFQWLLLIILYFVIFVGLPVLFTLHSDKYDFYFLLVLSNVVGTTVVGCILNENMVWDSGPAGKILLVLMFLPICLFGTALAGLLAFVLYMKLGEVFLYFILFLFVVFGIGLMGLIIESLFSDER